MLSIPNYWQAHQDRIIHSIKTMLACILGFTIIKWIPFPTDQWLVITIIVVMCAQINVGSMLHKSYMRFLGTIAGSLFAALTLALFGPQHLAAITTVALATLFFSYIATSQRPYSEAGTLGAVTTAIILIGNNPTLFTALIRFTEITLGIIIAALVSQFVLPIHAKTRLKNNEAQTLRQLLDYYKLIISAEKPDSIALADRDELIVKQLVAQRALAREAARERLGSMFSTKDFRKLLQGEKEIFRAIFIIQSVFELAPNTKKLLLNLPAVQQFHKELQQAFTDLIAKLSNKKPTPAEITLPNTQSLFTAIQNSRKDFPVADSTYIDTFLMGIEIMAVRLEKLAVWVMGNEYFLSTSTPDVK